MDIIEKRHAKRTSIPQNAVSKNRKTQIKKHTTMHTNTIQSLLTAKGFKKVVPTDEILQALDNMTLHRFNKILDNKVKMTLEEAAAFANWLSVPIEDLTTTPTQQTHTLADKFGLNH
jgi:hypothetical protein